MGCDGASGGGGYTQSKKDDSAKGKRRRGEGEGKKEGRKEAISWRTIQKMEKVEKEWKDTTERDCDGGWLAVADVAVVGRLLEDAFDPCSTLHSDRPHGRNVESLRSSEPVPLLGFPSSVVCQKNTYWWWVERENCHISLLCLILRPPPLFRSTFKTYSGIMVSFQQEVSFSPLN